MVPTPLLPVTEAGELSRSFKFPPASPLSALVRQTSKSHRRAWEQEPPELDPPLSSWTQYPSTPIQVVPSSPTGQQQQAQQPVSPLLHSRFRVSTMTEMSSKDDTSFMDTSATSFIDSSDVGYRYYDRDSIYSNITVLPPSPLGQPGHKWPTTSPDPTPLSDTYIQREDAYAEDSFFSPPTVVVSSPDSDHKAMHAVQWRAPIAAPTSANFSRPVRDRRPLENTEEQKQRVIERNARQPHSPYSESTRSKSPSAMPQTQPAATTTRRSPGPSLPTSTTSTAYNQRTRLPPSTARHPSSLRLAAASTPPSLNGPNAFFSPPQIVVSPAPDLPPEHNSSPPAPFAVNDPPPPRKTPGDYLQLGIEHHEANRLKESAICFEMSANEQGGCGVGMLMWGLTLRHGWGCQKNEKQAFKWLQKAAQSAVDDLERARGGMESRVIQSELVLAIYEVGQCFFHGWGVQKDRAMAVSYYTTAAQLGDADAQQDLAFCLANGKGCKKDKKAAAKWHRAAVAQGGSDIGLAWIYKEKYQ